MKEDELSSDLFESLLKDATEKKVMSLIIDGKETEEIITELLKKGEGAKK